MRTPLISRRALGILVAFIGTTLLLSAVFHTSAATPTAQAHVAAAITPPPLPNSFPALHAAPMTGLPAIQNSGATISGIPQADVIQYVSGHLIPPTFSASGTPTLAHTNLMNSPQLAALLHEGSTGLGENAQVYYVELHGNFSVAIGPDRALTFPIAYEVFDAQTGNLLIEGLLPQEPAPPPAPTATTNPTQPTATPTKAVTPVIFVSISPQTKTQGCQGFAALPGWTLTIDNTKSNVAEPWTLSIPNNEPKTSTPWATASSYSGTAAAGGTSKVTITPASDICTQIGYSGQFTGNVKVTWPVSSNSTQFKTVPDTISGPPVVIG